MTTEEASLRERQFVLPDDVLFVSVDNLAPRVRDSLGADDGDLAVTRPGFRSPPRLIDASTAALLESFRPAARIVDGIIRFSSAEQLDPHTVLVEAFPALQVFTDANVLVPADSPHADGIPVPWAPGQVVAAVDIEKVVQRTFDTVVYRGMLGDHPVALKAAQRDAPEGTEQALQREARLLDRLDAATPRLLDAGVADGLSYIVLSWMDGVPVSVRASELRNRARPGWRHRILDLARRVVECYATLHERGICHGDVHAANVLVDSDDRVAVIDFGLARMAGGGPLLDHARRSGFGWYLDPEAAQRLLDGTMPDAVDEAAEQYAVASLVYEVCCGARHVDAGAEVEQLYTALVHNDMQPFTRSGFEAWPQVETVLGRALSKQPEDRFPSVSALASALLAASPPTTTDVDVALRTTARARVDDLLSEIGRLPALREAFSDAPVASCDQGAAGLAWFLYRVAIIRDRPDLLAMADLWCRRAALAVTADDAFHIPSNPSDDFSIDDCSVLHRAPGIHYVHALICVARGDRPGVERQVNRFVATSSSDGVNDLTLGRAGTLIAGTTLLRAIPPVLGDAVPAALHELCATTFDTLATVVGDEHAPGLQASQPTSLAHGWPGLVLALLRGAEVLDRPVTEGLARQAHVIADALVDANPRAPLAASWCNGAAGHVHMLLQAARQLGDAHFQDAATTAGWRTASHLDDHGHLCCGRSGRVFALLALYRGTGDVVWLQRARTVGRTLQDARLPAEGRDSPYSLFWGPLGPALALEELTAPEWAAMPLFGDQGWPKA